MWLEVEGWRLKTEGKMREEESNFEYSKLNDVRKMRREA